MGRERVEMAPLIDFVVVIDTPLEIALTRRLLRDIGPISLEHIEKASKEQLAEGFVEIVTYLEGYLSGYLDVGRDLYIAVQERAKENWDLELDGCLSVDELAQQISTAVKDKPKTGNIS